MNSPRFSPGGIGSNSSNTTTPGVMRSPRADQQRPEFDDKFDKLLAVEKLRVLGCNDLILVRHGNPSVVNRIRQAIFLHEARNNPSVDA